MEQVAAALMPSLRKLDSGTELKVEGKKKWVYAFTFFFTGDMPQQQENSGMMKQNATYECRFCYSPKGQLSDLTTDLVRTGRFHREVERLRARSTAYHPQTEGQSERTNQSNHRPRNRREAANKALTD